MMMRTLCPLGYKVDVSCNKTSKITQNHLKTAIFLAFSFTFSLTNPKQHDIIIYVKQK